MDYSPVVIIGAGPSGLALGVGLAKLGIKSTILEREPDVTEDPRGIVLMGDAVRIATRLGIGEDLCSTAGHAMKRMSFHRGNLGDLPFMPQRLDRDFTSQCAPECIAHYQPLMERSLRRRAADSGLCDIRSGCEVIHVEESPEEPVVVFRNTEAENKRLRCSWLVGADGKKGVLRKRYLEKHGIQQEVGLFRYEGTWVAANLEITAPTPESHPDFPLWKLNITPDEVMNEFWPEGFHFINDTKRPQVGGRFGPLTSFFWRYEFEIDSNDDTNSSEALFWKIFMPQLSRPSDTFDLTGEYGQISFPQDCIRLMRCRPFKFAALVANKWFHNRMVLIGDAAHVFPPFGGQGIASGIRDADSLAWRLALFFRTNMNSRRCEENLKGWNAERRHGVDEALRITARNGQMVNEKSELKAKIRSAIIGLLYRSEMVGNMVTDFLYRGEGSLSGCDAGFFLPRMGGGNKLPQVWIRCGNGKPTLSDQILIGGSSIFSLLVICDQPSTPNAVLEVEQALQKTQLQTQVLSSSSVYRISKHISESAMNDTWTVCTTPTLRQHGVEPPELYDPHALFSRFGGTRKYIIVRPDSYIYCSTSTIGELEAALAKLKMQTDAS